MTPEALIVAYLDDLDSKVEAMQRLIAEPNTMGDWTRITPMFERPIYRRRPDHVVPLAEVSEARSVEIQPPSSEQGVAGGDSKKAAAKPSSHSFNTPFAQLADLIKD
jgi:hypothetical protein